MTKRATKKKYECLGGPLCGKMEAGLKSDFGFPCFAFIDDDNRKHFYRLARAKSGGGYWHYLGTRGILKEGKVCLRLSPFED